MNPFREILYNALATGRLKSKYFWLMSCIGLVQVVVGFVLLWVVGHFLAAQLNVPMQGTTELTLDAKRWMLWCLISLPLCFYAGMVVVAGTFGVVMVKTGRFSADEALYYALLGRYPTRWFKEMWQ